MERISILYSLMFTLLVFYSNVTSADKVIILSDQWYPINGDPNSSKPGYMIEIARSILATHGHTLDYRLAPWKRSLLEVRKGNADCIVGAHKSDAPDFIFPDNNWGKVIFNFYTAMDSSWIYKSVEQLKLIRLGTISGYSYGAELDQYIKKNRNLPRVQLVAGNQALKQNIRKLLAKRIDAIVANNLVMDVQINLLNVADKIKSAGVLEFTEMMYIACSPNKESSKKYVKLFSDGIDDLRKSGKLKNILNKYSIQDWY